MLWIGEKLDLSETGRQDIGVRRLAAGDRMTAFGGNSSFLVNPRSYLRIEDLAVRVVNGLVLRLVHAQMREAEALNAEMLSLKLAHRERTHPEPGRLPD